MPALKIITDRLHLSPSHVPYHEWASSEDKAWAAFYRLENGYLIHFNELADFIVSNDGSDVSSYPLSGISKHTINHLYHNIVLPLALSRQRKLVLHGSAVEVNNHAIAFLGPSGRGKSTLAASFSTNGYSFFTDDCLLLDKIGSQYFVQPSHPSIRLWDDSRENLIPDTARIAPSVSFTPKARLLADNRISFCNHPHSLQSVYFLGDGNSTKISITPIKGKEAMMALEQNSFLLELNDKKILTSHFRNISSLAQQPIFFRLDYPRQYEALPEVRQAIVDHVQQTSSTVAT